MVEDPQLRLDGRKSIELIEKNHKKCVSPCECMKYVRQIEDWLAGRTVYMQWPVKEEKTSVKK